ncbi:PID-CTERM protein-sorting domain-containing protein [Hymenobacter cellulosivorans]|uniref:VPDSG-CTERM sorting domain-containing protein n=1 Tax=Hymenobacter cellulosivorans TaxID=2932249 RepID=A0ABY4FAB7_9BACT|nr:hypothetical protein [Hymenobacter cellulosivorans]UOQ53616.1 hypothetical protein MUN80_02395 [Hymenobacter cellulosivorans]
MTTSLFRRLALSGLLFLGLSQVPALAQGPGVGGPSPGATTAPIDGGASLLLAGGVALALRRLRRR